MQPTQRDLREFIASRSDPAPDGCWVWRGKRGSWKTPYGATRVRGRYERAHRLAYEAWNGDVPPGLHVLHSCDNPLCVNPAHLWAGTHADNMADMMVKGRHGYGVRPEGDGHVSTKVSDADVRRIRADGRPSRVIADDYGISKTQVLNIKNDRSRRGA